MIMASLCNENYSSRRLKELAKIYLNEPCLEAKALSKIKSKYKKIAKERGVEFHYGMIPKYILKPYAIKDAVYTIKLAYLFSKPLEQYQALYEFEKSLIPIIVQMQTNGMKVDVKLLDKTVVKVKSLVKQKKNEMQAMLRKSNIQLGQVFNSNSTKQLQLILDKLGIMLVKKTKTGYSVDVEVLESINHSFVKVLLEYRFLSKLYSTYYYPIWNEARRNKNNRVHFQFYQTGAKTGRFSAERIQTIPRNEDKSEKLVGHNVRQIFIPRKNYVLVCFDYEQIEMRLFAHVSNCQRLLDNINNGNDPHMGAAYDVFGKKVMDYSEEVKKLARRAIKDINFGVIYGMGVNKLRAGLTTTLRDLQKKMGNAKIQIESPAVILMRYHEMYPVKEYMQQVTSELYRKGYITITCDSSLMKFTRDYRIPQDMAYRGPNAKIQGLASYVMKYGMKRSYDWVMKEKVDAKLLATIHDELIWEIVEDNNIMNVKRQIAELMSDKVTFQVPITVSIKLSDKSWGDTKEIKI
jgi:DNA polymerase-1